MASQITSDKYLARFYIILELQLKNIIVYHLSDHYDDMIII